MTFESANKHAISKPEFDRSGAEVIEVLERHAKALVSLHSGQQFVLAALAGGFISIGALLIVALTAGINQPGLEIFFLRLGFAAGFGIVVFSGAALFTEVNVAIPIYLWRIRCTTV